jgi:hypothetical protein
MQEEKFSRIEHIKEEPHIPVTDFGFYFNPYRNCCGDWCSKNSLDLYFEGIQFSVLAELPVIVRDFE